MQQDPSLPKADLTDKQELSLEHAGFDRRYRLLNAADFDGVFSQAQRSSDRYFTVLYCRNSLAWPRLGLAIAKKRVRRAVGRNRIKRLVRESFRQTKKQLLGTDIVIMARDAADRASNPDLKRSLARHWRHIAEHQRKPDRNKRQHKSSE